MRQASIRMRGGRQPEIPLHTNGSENDIRCHVTKRKVSGGTWSEAGRDTRDACLRLGDEVGGLPADAGAAPDPTVLDEGARQVQLGPGARRRTASAGEAPTGTEGPGEG